MDYKKRYQRLINLSFHSYNKWMQLTQRVADLQHTATVNSGVLYLGTNEVSKLIAEMKKSTEPLKQELTGLLNDKIQDDLTSSSVSIEDKNESDDDPFMNYHAKASDIPADEQASDDITISRDEYDRLKAQNSLYQNWIDADALSRQNKEESNESESVSEPQSTNPWDQTIPGEEPASKSSESENLDNTNDNNGQSVDQDTVKQLANDNESNAQNDDATVTNKTEKKEIKADVGEDGRLHLNSKVNSEEIENPAVPDKVVNDDASDIATKVSESAKQGREEDNASIESSVNDVSKQIDKMNVDDISDESVNKSANDKTDTSSNNKSTTGEEDADENALLTGNDTNNGDNTNTAPLDDDSDDDDVDETDDENSEATMDELMNPSDDDALDTDDAPF